MIRIGDVHIVSQLFWTYLEIMPFHGNIISRHDRVQDSIMTACSSANLSPVSEQKHLLPENNSRPVDVYLPSFIAGQPAA